MNIYTLKNQNTDLSIRFLFSKENELILSHHDQKHLENTKKMIAEHLKNGVWVEEDGKLTSIAKSDQKYQQALINHLRRAGFDIDQSETMESISKIAKQLKNLDLPAKMKKDLLEKASFSNPDQVKQLASILKE